MGKVTKIVLILMGLIQAQESPSIELQTNCLKCHSQQKIPSELIYRRYLLKYSTKERIKSKLLNYLSDPKREKSIMPKQFFLKFPEKIALEINSTILEKSINEYLNFFDVEKRLILKR